MKIVVVVVDLIFLRLYLFLFLLQHPFYNNTKLTLRTPNIPKQTAAYQAHSVNSTNGRLTERTKKNLWLTEAEVSRLSTIAVNTEKVAIPIFALLALPSLISSLMAAINAGGSQFSNNDNSQNQPLQVDTISKSLPDIFSFIITGQTAQQPPIALIQLQLQSIGNSLLDLLSVFGEMKERPICSIGNLVRLGVNGTMVTGNDDTKRIANIFYNFASGLIAIGWGIQGQPDLSAELKEQQTLLDKTKYQAEKFAGFWEELPSKLMNNLKGEKVKGEKLPLKTRLSKYGYFSHALMAFVSTGILLFSNLLPAEHTHFKGEVGDNEQNYIRNTTESTGWNLGKISRLPLLISIFADAFNPYNLSSHKLLGSLLSFAYGLSAVANMLWMQIPQVAATTDFAKNLLSNLRSLLTRVVNNNK